MHKCTTLPTQNGPLSSYSLFKYDIISLKTNGLPLSRVKEKRKKQLHETLLYLAPYQVSYPRPACNVALVHLVPLN